MRDYSAAAAPTAAAPADPTAATPAPATPTPTADLSTAATAAVISTTTVSATTKPRSHRVGQTAHARRRCRAGPVPGRRGRSGGGGGGGQREPDPVSGPGPVQDHEQDVREQQTSHVVADGMAGTATTGRRGPPAASVAASPSPAETGCPALGIRFPAAEDHDDHDDGCAAEPMVPQVFLMSTVVNVTITYYYYYYFNLSLSLCPYVCSFKYYYAHSRVSS